MPIQNWQPALSQLMIRFAERFNPAPWAVKEPIECNCDGVVILKVDENAPDQSWLVGKCEHRRRANSRMQQKSGAPTIAAGQATQKFPKRISVNEPENVWTFQRIPAYGDKYQLAPTNEDRRFRMTHMQAKTMSEIFTLFPTPRHLAHFLRYR